MVQQSRRLFYRYVFILGKPASLRPCQIRIHFHCLGGEKSYRPDRRLLRARRERPARRAAEQRDELAPSHSLRSRSVAR
jgi:hypothetical protein